MRTLNGVDVAGLSAALLSWWESHGRGGIPWKLLPDGVRPAPDQELDAYPIWIAEVMLQQTQLAVVLPPGQQGCRQPRNIRPVQRAHPLALFIKTPT